MHVFLHTVRSGFSLQNIEGRDETSCRAPGEYWTLVSDYIFQGLRVFWEVNVCVALPR
jgi:hypothetical protein